MRYVGRQMPIDDPRHFHPLKQRPDHRQRSKVAALVARLVSKPSDCHPFKMAKMGQSRNTSFWKNLRLRETGLAGLSFGDGPFLDFRAACAAFWCRNALLVDLGVGQIGRNRVDSDASAARSHPLEECAEWGGFATQLGLVPRNLSPPLLHRALFSRFCSAATIGQSRPWMSAASS